MYKLVVVIGLPGSGKSTYCKNNLSEYVIFDDFINNFYSGKIYNSIINNKSICINDPRLCDIEIFNKYIEMFLKYINKNDIHLILFENNAENALSNCLKRNDDKIAITNTIYRFSNIYNLDNYKNYHHEILKVSLY